MTIPPLAAAQALAPGVMLVGTVAIAAWFLGGVVPLVGAPVLALIGGLVLRNAAGTPASLRPGADFTLKRLLQLAIILFGATLSFSQVIAIGSGSFVVIRDFE